MVALNSDIDPALFHAIIQQESMYNENAIGNHAVVSYGLGQLTIATAKAHCNLTKTHIMDPVKNLKCSAKVLNYQINRYGGRIDKAISAYNAGTYTPKNVKYVNEVMEKMIDYGHLSSDIVI